MENKRHTIANGLKKNAEKSKPIKTHESQREGGCSVFFNYVKNILDNYSVREFQDVNSRSEFKLDTNIATKTTIDPATLQCSAIRMSCGVCRKSFPVVG